MLECGFEVMGKIELEPTSDYTNRLAWVVRDKKYGYIDSKGNELIPCIYDCACDFSEGLAAVMKGGKWGYIDRNGKEVIPFVYPNAKNFSEGLAAVKDEKWPRWKYIDKSNRVVPYTSSHDAKNFSEGFAGVMHNYGMYSSLWDFIDKKGWKRTSAYEDIKDNYPKYLLRTDDFAGGNYQGIKTMHVADFLLSKEY